MALYILDPSLTDETGHHFNAALAILNEAKRAGDAIHIIANSKISPRSKEALNAAAYFPRSIYDKLHYTPSLSTDAQDFAGLNKLFVEDLERLPAAELVLEDCLLFPTITHNQLLGLGTWLSRMGPENAPSVAIYLIFLPEWRPDDGGASTEIRIYYKAAFRRFPAWASDRVLFMTETEALKAEYEDLCPFPILTQPLPTGSVQVVGGTAEPQNPDRRVHVVFPGYASEEKGFHLLPEIIQLLLKSFPNICFSIQANTMSHSDRTKMASELLRQAAVSLGEGVLELYEEALSSEAYSALLNRADILLLPYDPTAYKKRGSGVVREGVYSGTPMIVPNHTSIGAFAAEKGAASLFDEHSPRSIARAILDALINLEDLKETAGAGAKKLLLDGEEAKTCYGRIMSFHRNRFTSAKS